MQPRPRPLVFLAALFCACASELSQTTTKSVDSAATAALAEANAATPSGPSPAAAAEALRRVSDTIVPRSYVDTTAWVDAKREIDTTASAPDFQCAPRMFTEADTLTLRIATPHGDWLSVKRPDETVFYLVAPKAEGAPNYSVMPSDTFKDQVQLRFLGEITSRPGLGGSGDMGAIFNQRGHYTFRVGTDLGTNRPSDVRECTIRLVPLSKY
jgi:hypothetical protein